MGILERSGVIGCARAGLDLVLPARCAGCGFGAADDPVTRGLCDLCRSDLDQLDPVLDVLSGPLPVPVASLGDYDGTLRRVLLGYKERGHTAVRHELGARLAALMLGLGIAGAGRPVLLVPVPSSAASSRARGHQPVTALGAVAASNLRWCGVAATALTCLRHTRRLADQSELSAAGRQANLLGAFSVRRRRRHLMSATGPVGAGEFALVLVDDVVTTGATASEAVRALAAAGAAVEAVITLANTTRRYPVARA